MTYRVAVDIGGTFTDLAALDTETGRIVLSKVSTTPEGFAQGVVDVLKHVSFPTKEASYFVHGQTVVINTILQRKGVKTALLTTKGFRDVLEFQRANRIDVYNFGYEKPVPFVPRSLRFELDERVDSKGRVLKKLDEADVRDAAEKCAKLGVKSIAICFINSYTNPENELKCSQIIEKSVPGIKVTPSSKFSREWREYERSSTAVMNAYVQPVVEDYLDTLETSLNRMGLSVEKHAMQSNGGVITFSEARRSPLHLVESGPVGGAIAAAQLGTSLGESNVITLDIGGTTAKTTLIDRSAVRVTDQYEIEASRTYAGYPVLIPVVDIVEIGAGGGSIAWIDAGNSVHVGPQSAGASPGPACYGKGGTEPTVTDANLVLGRINPDYFLGGEIKLDEKRAFASFAAMSKKLGMRTVDLALGSLKIMNNNMINALKLVSVRRGYDPRDFVLVAYGGLGAGHAGTLAEELRIRKVIIPVAPSHFSAFGMLLADLQKHFIRTHVQEFTRGSLPRLRTIISEMKEEAMASFDKRTIAGKPVSFDLNLDMRYAGQAHTIRLVLPESELTEGRFDILRKRYDKLHEFTYGFMMKEESIELVNIRLIVRVKSLKPKLRRYSTKGNFFDALKGSRKAWFDDGTQHNVSVYDRELLPVERNLEGPAIIEEHASTTIVNPGQRLSMDRHGALVIQTSGA